ncbi:hypothetical protein OPV22_025425 [Ensete ventricosum]|uniref:Uncharacterized protein n=1 Tax=Ensete ventricosum TaxID=4639 RepID=A0AAV8Q7T4_ENSVE|nr:hypothetical protein OPV22_025425 [Ensete ventricosum]
MIGEVNRNEDERIRKPAPAGNHGTRLVLPSGQGMGKSYYSVPRIHFTGGARSREASSSSNWNPSDLPVIPKVKFCWVRGLLALS